MDLHPAFCRRPAEDGRDERFSPSGQGPSLRLLMLGFAAALAALLGAAVTLPSATAGMLSSNAVAVGP